MFHLCLSIVWLCLAYLPDGKATILENLDVNIIDILDNISIYVCVCVCVGNMFKFFGFLHRESRSWRDFIGDKLP